eukprot:TRINITY_DN2465_c0_g1_i7.p1 TRINITY_DN2465_c0_g1~~TRINITY_DN2465_c0_g1_i7.p1  ORF type:complete len:127 (-),score=26.52 TRINITY_DN2465_c0_g1_i7:680-1060(-)
MSKGIDELPSDVEELIRQRSELLKRKREKEEQLASLLPGDVESLRLHRESLLAKKKVKEHELAQLLKKQQVLCGVKKSRRTKKELVQDWNTNAPMVSFLVRTYLPLGTSINSCRNKKTVSRIEERT